MNYQNIAISVFPPHPHTHRGVYTCITIIVQGHWENHREEGKERGKEETERRGKQKDMEK